MWTPNRRAVEFLLQDLVEHGIAANTSYGQELPLEQLVVRVLDVGVVVGERVFVTAIQDEELFTIGLDRASGAVLWKRQAEHAGLEEIHRIGSHAQASPTADDEVVVTFFGSCGMFCYDHDGALLWKRPMGPFKNSPATCPSQ